MGSRLASDSDTDTPTELARRVMVVEDDRLLADLLGSHLLSSGFAVNIANDASTALAVLDAFDPDALLLDIDLGLGPSGIDLAHEVVRRAPHVALVFLTRHGDARFGGGELPTEVPVAFLCKTRVSAPAEVVAALDAALGERVGPEARHDQASDRRLATLTKSQFQVLRMIAEGRSNAEIVAARDSTERAVQHLIRRTLHAAGIDEQTGNRRVLAARAYIHAAGAMPRDPDDR